MADSEVVTDRTPLLERKGSGVSIDVSNRLGIRSSDTEQQKFNSVVSIDCSYGVTNSVDVTDDMVCSLPVSDDSPILEQSVDIVSIFVVAFDTKKGNIIEWYLPNDCNVDGIEFRAMASGSHRVQTDFIYFKRGQLYGLACFENMPVVNAQERGARMKSVGVLAVSYGTLHHHMSFLRHQVRHLLENPGSYSDLEAYYEEHKASFPTFEAFSNYPNEISTKLWSNILPIMKITHPAGCFSQFLNFFGERIFVLWKLALLKKRILFFSPPPIGVVCYRVYGTTCLTAHRISEIGHWQAQPFFYVNIADIDLLKCEKTFVACTTEKIFQSKSSMYDIYVDNQNFFSDIPMIQKMMCTTFTDKVKHEQLCKLQTQVSKSHSLGDEVDETWFMRYFMSLNENLFRSLLSASQSEGKQWTLQHMNTVGLDPVNDRTFIMELADMYGIDIVPPADALCCTP